MKLLKPGLAAATITTRMLMLSLFAVALSSCALVQEQSKQELILGSWQGNFEGQNMTLTYTEDEVVIDEFGISFPYEWVDEDTVRLDAMGQVVTSTVEFVSEDEMIQTSDQGVQNLLRVE